MDCQRYLIDGREYRRLSAARIALDRLLVSSPAGPMIRTADGERVPPIDVALLLREYLGSENEEAPELVETSSSAPVTRRA